MRCPRPRPCGAGWGTKSARGSRERNTRLPPLGCSRRCIASASHPRGTCVNPEYARSRPTYAPTANTATLAASATVSTAAAIAAAFSAWIASAIASAFSAWIAAALAAALSAKHQRSL